MHRLKTGIFRDATSVSLIIYLFLTPWEWYLVKTKGHATEAVLLQLELSKESIMQSFDRNCFIIFNVSLTRIAEVLSVKLLITWLLKVTFYYL